MKRIAFLFLLAALLMPLLTSQIYAVDFKKGSYVSTSPSPGDFAVNVNLLGEKGSVYGPGKEIRLSFNTTKDAYVIVYDIDADGNVQLLYPEEGRPTLSEGRKTYFLPVPGRNVYWQTGSTTGVEYIHAVAVTDRNRINEDELYFLAGNERLSNEKQFHVDLDPYLAFNMIDEELVSGAENDPPATDFTYFYINKHVEYPRYLCSKCHSPEKLSDPYTMECPEIVIEKITYDAEPHYPYPPLYDVSHVGEENEGDTYAYDSTGDEEDRDYADTVSDTHLYLSVYSGYSWYRPYYPYYGINLIGFDPFYWDVWWDFGWYGIGGYYWWPGYGWWYPPSYYWAYHYRYPWWGYGDYWYWHGRDRHWAYGGCCRPLYGQRTVSKRYLDYSKTNTDIRRSRAIAGSRLMETKTRDIAQRFERSGIERRAIGGSLGRTSIGNERSVSPVRESKRTVVYGAGQVRRGAVRAVNRATRTGQIERARRQTDTRTPESNRGAPEQRIPQTREVSPRERSGDSKRDVIRRSAPARRSSDSGRKESTRSNSSGSSTRGKSGNVDRSGSNTDKRRTSAYSSSSFTRDASRGASPATARTYRGVERSASRSVSSAPATARSSSPPARAAKSRSR
jgi:hypothetical protein